MSLWNDPFRHSVAAQMAASSFFYHTKFRSVPKPSNKESRLRNLKPNFGHQLKYHEQQQQQQQQQERLLPAITNPNASRTYKNRTREHTYMTSAVGGGGGPHKAYEVREVA